MISPAGSSLFPPCFFLILCYYLKIYDRTEHREEHRTLRWFMGGNTMTLQAIKDKYIGKQLNLYLIDGEEVVLTENGVPSLSRIILVLL